MSAPPDNSPPQRSPHDPPFPWPPLSYSTHVRDIAVAKSLPCAVLTMEADYGGEWFLSCPASLVNTDAETLTQLLADLARVSCGRGFQSDDHSPACEADWWFTYRPSHPELPAEADATRSIFLQRELEHELELRGQIEAVLLGRSKRLDLPDGFPVFAKVPLAQARAHRFGRVLLHCGVRGWLILNTPARDVRIEEPAVDALLPEIDQSPAIPAAHHGRRPAAVPSRAEYVIQRLGHSRDQSARDWHRSDMVRGLSTQIMAVLRGERAHLAD